MFPKEKREEKSLTVNRPLLSASARDFAYSLLKHQILFALQTMPKPVAHDYTALVEHLIIYVSSTRHHHGRV